MLERRKRYLQLAINTSAEDARLVIPRIPHEDRILVEAGTPFIKRYGAGGIAAIKSLWRGYVVADIKTMDGAREEVEMCASAGANAVVALGAAPRETLDIFIKTCESLGVDSMIDMMYVENTLAVLRPLKKPPRVVVVHRGRDEEGTKGKMIQYKQINKIKSKYDVFISAAGGVDLEESQDAAFNGAEIVVVNIVRPGQLWKGLGMNEDIPKLARQFLRNIE